MRLLQFRTLHCLPRNYAAECGDGDATRVQIFTDVRIEYKRFRSISTIGSLYESRRNKWLMKKRLEYNKE